MSKRNQIDRAIEQVDKEISALQDVRNRLMQQKVATPKRTRKSTALPAAGRNDAQAAFGSAAVVGATR